MDLLKSMRQLVSQSLLFSAWLALFAFSLNAEEVELKMKEPMLIASPNVCELKKDTYLCEMKAALIWEMPKAGHYCLYEQGVELALQCWQNNWSGNHVLQFQSDKPVTYLLRPYAEQTVIREVTINVIGTLEQRIRAKRRRRFLRFF